MNELESVDFEQLKWSAVRLQCSNSSIIKSADQIEHSCRPEYWWLAGREGHVDAITELLAPSGQCPEAASTPQSAVNYSLSLECTGMLENDLEFEPFNRLHLKRTAWERQRPNAFVHFVYSHSNPFLLLVVTCSWRVADGGWPPPSPHDFSQGIRTVRTVKLDSRGGLGWATQMSLNVSICAPAAFKLFFSFFFPFIAFLLSLPKLSPFAN